MTPKAPLAHSAAKGDMDRPPVRSVVMQHLGSQAELKDRRIIFEHPLLAAWPGATPAVPDALSFHPSLTRIERQKLSARPLAKRLRTFDRGFVQPGNADNPE